MKTIEFSDYQNMCRAAAWNVSKKYRLPYDDLESQSYLIFFESIERFDPSKGAAFSTFLFSRLRTLSDYAYKEIRFLKSIPEDMSVDDMEIEVPSGIEVFEEILQFYNSARFLLSPDAHKLLLYLMNEKSEKKPVFSRVSKSFRSESQWGPKRIKEAWEELKSWYCSYNTQSYA